MYPKLTQSKRYSDDETGFQNDLQQVRFNIIHFFKIKIFFHFQKNSFRINCKLFCKSEVLVNEVIAHNSDWHAHQTKL